MAVEIINEGERVTAELSGDLDHHSAAEIRSAIDAALENSTPATLILDFNGVNFMDSSGIGLILGRTRVLESFGGKLSVKNATPFVEKIIKLSGLSYLLIK